MDVDFTSPKDVDKAVKQKISQMTEEEKEKLILKARKDDKFNLQTARNDKEILFIAAKYELYEEQKND